jgi:hypothetical protein
MMVPSQLLIILGQPKGTEGLSPPRNIRHGAQPEMRDFVQASRILSQALA